MATSKGMITSHNAGPTELNEATPPAPRPSAKSKAQIDPKQPLKGASRFVTTDGSRSLRIKISHLPGGGDAADEQRTEACRAVSPDGYVSFRALAVRDGERTQGALVVTEPAVVAWLRGRIASGHLSSVEEDVTLLSEIHCPHCEATFVGAKAQKELAAHLASEHTEDGA
jgi:hypothetical protein